MKNLFILLLFCTITSFAQIGKSFDEMISIIKSNNSYKDYKIVKQENSYSIEAVVLDNNYIKDVFYFGYNDNLCYLIGRYLNKPRLNSTIEESNKNFVKLSDLKWKDYFSKTIFEIIIEQDFFIEMIYKEK